MRLSVSQEKIATVRDLQTKVSALAAKIKDGGFFRVVRNKETIGFLVPPKHMLFVDDLHEDIEILKSKYLTAKVAKSRTDKKRIPLDKII